jgi:hypothetical protein
MTKGGTTLDNYREEIVVKHNRAANNIAYALLLVVMGITALVAAMNLSAFTYAISGGGGIIATLIMTVVPGGIAALIFWKKDLLRLEYEYTFTNGELDFACVMGNKKRKNLGSMRVKNVEACGLVSSGSFQRYLKMQGLKKMNWFLNRDAELLYFFYQKDGAKKMIICEPTDEMIGLIKQYLPRGVFQQN